MTQVIVPSKFFRESVRALYINALTGVGVKARDITVHIDSTATLNVRAEDMDKIAAVDGIVFLSDLSAKGNVKVVIPAAIDFLKENDPTFNPHTPTVSAKRELTPEREKELADRAAMKEHLRSLIRRYIPDDEAESEDDSI